MQAGGNISLDKFTMRFSLTFVLVLVCVLLVDAHIHQNGEHARRKEERRQRKEYNRQLKNYQKDQNKNREARGAQTLRLSPWRRLRPRLTLTTDSTDTVWATLDTATATDMATDTVAMAKATATAGDTDTTAKYSHLYLVNFVNKPYNIHTRMVGQWACHINFTISSGKSNI